MFCKWCGNTVASGETTCRRCKKPLPAQSDCGGIAELLAAIKPAAGLGAAAAGGSVGGASADASSLKAARSEAAAAKAEADQAKKKAKTMGLLVIILAAVLVVALLVMSIWVANLSGKVRDLQDNGPSVSDSIPTTPSSEEPVVSEEPEITLLFINMKSQTVSVDDPLPDFTYTITDTDGNEVDISTIPGLEITPVCNAATDAPGTYTISATYTAVEDYEFYVLDSNLVVLDESLTLIYINVDSASMTQGQKLPDFTHTFTDKDGNPYASFITQPEIEYICTADGSTTGTYPIDAQVTNKGELSDFQFVVNKGALTVKAKPVISVTITMDSHTITAGDSKPAFTYKATDKSGKAITVPGLTVNTSCEATNTNTPGTYKITATVNPKDGYKFTVVPGTLTINQKKVTEVIITMDSHTITAGDAKPAFTYTVTDSSGKNITVPGLKVTPSCTAKTTAGVGKYTITATTNSVDGYKFTVKNGTLTIEAPSVSAPVQSDPVQSDPVQSDPVPSDPVPSDPVQSDPVPSDPVQSDPVPSDPVQSDPVPSDPVPSDPVPSDPVPSDPVPSDPVPSDPVPSDPVQSDPVQSDPVQSDPVQSDPIDP